MKGAGKNFYFLKKFILSLLALAFILVDHPFAGENFLSLQGKNGCPFFDHQGNFNVVYINLKGGISQATLQEEGYTQKISIQEVDCQNDVNFICAKKDKAGKIWLAWEEREYGRDDIYIAQLKNKRIANSINVTADQQGFNFSPCIDFSFHNNLWITWINYFQKKYTILVKNLNTDQIWEINSFLTSSALSPQIIIDGTEKIWIFWVGQLSGHDEVLYTHFDGDRWREPLSLNQHSDVPHITPSVSLGFNGFPHIVWSAYDGDDYELYYSHWDGNKWMQERRITDNQNIADTCPSISLLLDAIPVVAWQRYWNEKRSVCLTYRISNEWNFGMNISGDKSITNPPRLVSLGERMGVLWQSKTEIKATLFDLYELCKFFFSKRRNIHFPRILALDRDKYIGFGNSITYGFIKSEPNPDKGYIPRLEELIDENIKDSEVVNRGVAGEKTSEGLSRVSSVINEDQAKTIFLMEGTNDIKHTEISTDTIAFNLKKMAESALGFGMTVFLASIIPLDTQEAIKERIIDLNEKIKSVASELNIYFVDQNEAFGGSHSDSLYSDAAHPNEEGYQLMAETWYEALGFALPSIELDTTSLFFEAGEGEANPASQVFKIRNSGAGTLDYQISGNKEWIGLSPASGDSKGEWDEVEVSVDISNLYEENNKGQVTISSENASNSPQKLIVNLHIQFPPLFPPLNFRGEEKKNRSLSQLEYIHVLTWEVNPQNKFIEKYNIYLEEEGNKILLKELDAKAFEYWHRKVNKDKVYKYGLTAVDKYGRESEPVYVEVR